VAQSGIWVCDKCISERFRLPKEKLQDNLYQIVTLTRNNKALEEQLQLAAGGREVCGVIRCQVILKFENAYCWMTLSYEMMELNFQT
jgi:hypothetical protein